MTTTAPDTGAKPETHMARARKRTAAKPAPETPESPRLPASFMTEALKANPGWRYLVEEPVPSYSLPPIVGQAGFAQWDAAFSQCGEAEDRALAEGHGEQAARRDRVFAPNDAWLRCSDLYVPPAPAGGLQPLPEDSAPAADPESAAGADSSSGSAEEPPPTSAEPAPADGEAAS